MTRCKTVISSLAAVIALSCSPPAGTAVRAAQAGSDGTLAPAYLDQLLAPVALYPDSLLAQVLLCSGNARKVGELSAWLKRNPHLKGSELQKAVQDSGFEPSFVALAPFPQVVELMAGNLTWTSQLGGAFAVDRGAVFDSIQRLRKQSQAAGNLKSTPQQTVESRTVEGGQQVIVIEPANPQVIYVPVYNPQVVYTQPAAATTTVIVHEDNNDDAAVAGALVGFAAGIAIGAAVNNNYYYGPYGWHGGGYMYNDAWDDYADYREDAREDWQDHREDLADERGDRADNQQEQRTERQENRQENRPESQAQRTERQQTRQENRPESQAQRSTTAQTASSGTRGSGSYESRGQSPSQSREPTAATQERSGTRSDAFSGYSSGKSERAASTRGQSSRSSSRSRSGGGGGRRR
jgi:hypothetical protein